MPWSNSKVKMVNKQLKAESGIEISQDFGEFGNTCMAKYSASLHLELRFQNHGTFFMQCIKEKYY